MARKDSFSALSDGSGISSVIRDSTGLLQSWRENGWALKIDRDPSGVAFALNAKRAGNDLSRSLTFGADGNLKASKGDDIPTMLMAEVLSSGAGRLAVVVASAGSQAISTPVMVPEVETASDGVALPINSLAKQYGWTGADLTSLTVVYLGLTYKKTIAYVAGVPQSSTAWVKQ